MDIGVKIAAIARSYIGQKETTNNSGFVDPNFQNKIMKTGWAKGNAWCAAFAELVYLEAYKDSPAVLSDITKLFSASATATLVNFKKDPKWVVDRTPEKGALAVWQHGTGWQGHIGIVDVVTKGFIATIDGNTNNAGGREGIEVAIKTRPIDFSIYPNKLNLLGFIHPFHENIT